MFFPHCESLNCGGKYYLVSLLKISWNHYTVKPFSKNITFTEILSKKPVKVGHSSEQVESFHGKMAYFAGKLANFGEF